MTGTVLRIPITNIYGGGDYTAPITIGSQDAVVNVILDTGSSTLAVVPGDYMPSSDTDMKPTALAQDVLYGTGGWTGPVVTTSLTLGSTGQTVTVDAYIAVADEQEVGNFGNAGGILGLAFNQLNQAYNLSAYLTSHDISPPVTYPWPFPVKNSSAAVQRFAKFLSRMPQEDLPPYFTALEASGVTKNLFAFYTLRSVPNMTTANPATDPTNQGFFILGGGPEQTDLYTGSFIEVDVVDDLYYNTNLVAVQVGNGTPVDAAALPAEYAATMVSNSIVDSGTNGLVVAPDVYAALIKGLTAANSSFAKLMASASNGQGIPGSELTLSEWPTVSFILKGPTGNNVTLTCTPETYWQTGASSNGEAIFQISNSQMPQSILGLPLLNNYYAVFDRTQDPYGVISFATIAAAA